MFVPLPRVEQTTQWSYLFLSPTLLCCRSWVGTVSYLDLKLTGCTLLVSLPDFLSGSVWFVLVGHGCCPLLTKTDESGVLFLGRRSWKRKSLIWSCCDQRLYHDPVGIWGKDPTIYLSLELPTAFSFPCSWLWRQQHCFKAPLFASLLGELLPTQSPRTFSLLSIFLSGCRVVSPSPAVSSMFQVRCKSLHWFHAVAPGSFFNITRSKSLIKGATMNCDCDSSFLSQPTKSVMKREGWADGQGASSRDSYWGSLASTEASYCKWNPILHL